MEGKTATSDKDVLQEKGAPATARICETVRRASNPKKGMLLCLA